MTITGTKQLVNSYSFAVLTWLEHLEFNLWFLKGVQGHILLCFSLPDTNSILLSFHMSCMVLFIAEFIRKLSAQPTLCPLVCPIPQRQRRNV